MQYKSTIKRLLDILLSAMALLLLWPVLLILSLCIWVSMGRPIFFRQQRAGLNGKLFSILKFRTMKEVHDEKGELLPDNLRITWIGKFLRKSSLDELPEILNVLLGEMSIVGPRPLLPEYLAYYTPEQNRRHEVKPGITGWAQINGRNKITWAEKFALDVWYVDHLTFSLDVKIIFLTVVSVLKAADVNQSNEQTMEKFRG